ncbi:MAG: hypothetical protein JWO11_4140 [Nocardioides sp.]|nr:hypothetical protein [Nocardioides sp.]
MSEPDLVVIRPSVDLQPGLLPSYCDGWWFDRARLPGPAVFPTLAQLARVAVPTGRFEVRYDGAVAEVYEVRS